MRNYSKKNITKKDAPRYVTRPYCVVCERFGHDIKDCKNQSDKSNNNGQKCFTANNQAMDSTFARSLKKANRMAH